MNTLRQSLIFPLALVAAAGCGAVHADPANAACGSVTGVQRHIVERADQGMDSLRSYVWRTSIVQRIEMTDVKESLDAWRAAVDCQKEAAAARAAQEQARVRPTGQGDAVRTAAR